MRGRVVMVIGGAIAACALAVAPRAFGGSFAQTENPPAELRILPFSGVLPACDDPWVLAQVASAFAARESGYWASGLAIAVYDEIREVGYRANGPSYIPRRYCRAEADFNDGLRRRLAYQIGEQLGFIGLGYGVTWCVVGLDRNHAFGRDCRAAGP